MNINTEEIKKERSTLIALLLDMPLGPPENIDVSGIDPREKFMLLATSCAALIEISILTLARGDKPHALRGLDGLVKDMQRHINEAEI